MTIGKDQLKVSDDEEEEEDLGIDDFIFEDKPKAKGKVIQVDRRQFQDVNEKIAKQNAADAFRQRFATKKKKLAVHDADVDGDDDIDSFLGGLKLDCKIFVSINLSFFIQSTDSQFH